MTLRRHFVDFVEAQKTSEIRVGFRRPKVKKLLPGLGWAGGCAALKEDH